MQNSHNALGRTPLEEIQVFVEVAAIGSFSAAAERLNLSHSSLSRKVAYLEDWLGVRLFERRAHGVQLTQIGVSYFLQFRDGLNIVNGALVGQSKPVAENVVHISLFHIFATTWLFPRHQMLLAKSDGVQPRYVLDRRLTDFTDGIDLAIRFGMGEWARTRTVRLMVEDVGPVGGALTAAAIGVDPDPEVLLGFPLIHLTAEGAWRSWFASRGVTYRLRPHDYVFEDQLVLLSAVENNVGIGLSRVGTQGLIEEGRLYRLSEHVIPGDSGYHLVRPIARPLSPAARIYAREILREARVSEAEYLNFISD